MGRAIEVSDQAVGPSPSDRSAAAGQARAMAAPGSVLLVSCYELGHQPFALASPWAQLEVAGFGVHGVDASIDLLEDEVITRAWLVAISVPMHTALRLGVEVARSVRLVNPAAHVCMFGLYASMNSDHLLGGIVDSVIGGEFEQALVDLAGALDGGSAAEEAPGVTAHAGSAARPVLRRLPFVRPTRDRLPPLDRYAALLGPEEGERRVAGYVEASRGCLHQCLHCPITPVYMGRFFIVPRDIVLADAAQQIEAGARHITFGDPDFMNGVGHSMAVVRDLHAAHPEVTFDVTTKVEHVLKYPDRFPELAELGCIFVVSALESLSDVVLAELDKGHTRSDIDEAVRILDAAGVMLRPSFVAFTPWTTIDDYVELLDYIVERGLVDNVDPIQLAIRLLLPPGSALLLDSRPRPWLGELVADEFGFRWTHPDPRMDELHRLVSALVEEGARATEDAAVTIAKLRAAAYEMAGRPAPPRGLETARRFVPKLTEPWFCCAEPSAAQLEQVSAFARPTGKPDCCG